MAIRDWQAIFNRQAKEVDALDRKGEQAGRVIPQLIRYIDQQMQDMVQTLQLPQYGFFVQSGRSIIGDAPKTHFHYCNELVFKIDTGGRGGSELDRYCFSKAQIEAICEPPPKCNIRLVLDAQGYVAPEHVWSKEFAGNIYDTSKLVAEYRRLVMTNNYVDPGGIGEKIANQLRAEMHKVDGLPRCGSRASGVRGFYGSAPIDPYNEESWGLTTDQKGQKIDYFEIITKWAFALIEHFDIQPSGRPAKIRDTARLYDEIRFNLT